MVRLPQPTFSLSTQIESTVSVLPCSLQKDNADLEKYNRTLSSPAGRRIRKAWTACSRSRETISKHSCTACLSRIGVTPDKEMGPLTLASEYTLVWMCRRGKARGEGGGGWDAWLC